MKKYLENLEAELRKNNLSEEEIKDILADHEEMIETAIREGLTDADLEKKFGNPKDVAEELSQFTEKKQEKGREKELKMKTKEFTGISENYNVTFALVSEDISVELIEEDKIVVEYNGSRKLEDYEIEFENNEFVLRCPKTLGIFNFGRSNGQNDFLIKLPKGIQIGDFKMKSVSGDSEISDINAKSFALETSSGDSTLSNFKLEEFKIRTVNGDLEIENLVTNTFSISQVNGDLEMKNVDVQGDVVANTVSGDLELENVKCKDFSLRTVSGDVDANEFYPETLSLTSVSGDVTITNTDAEKQITVNHKKSVSGDITIRVKK